MELKVGGMKKYKKQLNGTRSGLECSLPVPGEPVAGGSISGMRRLVLCGFQKGRLFTIIRQPGWKCIRRWDL